MAVSPSLALISSGTDAVTEPDQSGQPNPSEPNPSDAPVMEFGPWGLDLAHIDPTIAPGDDFFAYFNGRWLAETQMPPEYSRYGVFTLLAEKSQADIRALVEEFAAASHPAGSAEARIADAYRSYLDVEAMDAAGIAPALPLLNRISQAQDLKELASLFGEAGFPSPLGVWVMVDQKQPERYVAGFGAGGIGLPDREYYLRDDEKSREIQAKYREYLGFLLKKAGYENAQEAASAVYQLEDSFARALWDRAVSRNRELTYNLVERKTLAGLASHFPLETMLNSAGLAEADEFIVWQLPPDAEKRASLGLSDEDLAKLGGGVPEMFRILGATPLPTLKAWMTARFLSSHADVLGSDLDEARFALFGQLMQGQEEQRPRWKRAIDAVEGQLGEVLGAAYVARHFPPAHKAAMDDLVSNLRKAMAQSLDESQWMGEATRAEALAKLDQFTAKIGYPQKFETYEGLEIRAGDPLGNTLRAGAWGWRKEKSKLGGPIDRAEWLMLPQTVNAYYYSSLNEIVFPAAILQPPFFDAKADPAVNYGAIGAVIGHEIGHGFDDQGAKSDGTGRLRDWWALEDRAAFMAMGHQLIKQYSHFCPLDEGKTCINGRLTLGENIGDIGGLSLAYRAYRMALGGKEAPVIDGLSGDQRFFLSWAQVWRSIIREDSLRQRLLTDPHSPAEYRVNGAVRNLDAWYRAFDVGPDHALYLPPEDRVPVW